MSDNLARKLTGYKNKYPQKSYLIKSNGDVIGNKCFNYFKGKDGLGTCNIKCQWWCNDDCPMWIPQDKWDTKEDWYFNQ